MQQEKIVQGDDTSQGAVEADHGQGFDLVAGQAFPGHVHRVQRPDRDHVARHDVAAQHLAKLAPADL
ncbi:hypothetical protein D3C72_2437140 [compost metagenome]